MSPMDYSIVESPFRLPASIHGKVAGRTVATNKPAARTVPNAISLRMARTILLVQIAFIFGGAVPYLDFFSHAGLYTYYLVMIACSCLCWAKDPRTRAWFKPLRPYVLWFAAFSLWLVIGDLAGHLPREYTWNVIRDLIRAFILWPALAAVLPDRDHLRRFICLITVALAANVVICYLTPTTPWLSVLIYRANNPYISSRQMEMYRAPGLWGNANQAGHAFLYGALLAIWRPGLWACLGWGAALLGVFLSASRQATYLMAPAMLAYAFLWTKISSQFGRFRYLKKWLPIMFLLGGLLIGFSILATDTTNTYSFDRVLKFESGKDSREYIMSLAYKNIWQRSPFFGSGSYSFRDYLIYYSPSVDARGCHNIYLAIWGEAGLFMLLAYLLVMAWGLMRIIQARLDFYERVPLLLMWFCYMSLGMTSHMQLADFNEVIFVALLFALPVVFSQPGKATTPASARRFLP